MSTSSPIKKIAVFCASSTNVPQKYFQIAAETASILLNLKLQVIYGGGSVGLMGEVADVYLKNNGNIQGIIPQFMIDNGWQHENISNMIVVNDMYNRKKQMIESADYILALPGGIGTYDELFEAITARQLHQTKAPVIILNSFGFYDKFLDIINHLVDEQFMHHNYQSLFNVIDNPKQLSTWINPSI